MDKTRGLVSFFHIYSTSQLLIPYMIVSGFLKQLDYIFFMNLITWLVFGVILGSLFNIWNSDRSINQMLGTYFFAISGAALGGLATNLLYGISLSSFSFTSLAIAISVSLLLLITTNIGRLSK